MNATSLTVIDDTLLHPSGGAGRALALLNSGGEEARIIGGAVRNALMGLAPGDIDIATTALPEEVMRRADANGIKCVGTGIEHGTVTLVIDGQPFEVTTLREDVETFGRKARVVFGRDWHRDAERRDFTVNAFSLTADGVVHDYVGGAEDLEARRVRFIGDASKRIAEDYLRILRFFRFHAAYGAGEPDPAGVAAAIAGREGLSQLSAERVRAELMKLLVAPGAASALEVMGDAGILTRLLGGVAYHATLAAMITAEAALGRAPDAVLRLGALAVTVVEDTERLSVRLRLSNAESKRLNSMARRWWRLARTTEANARARIYRIGPARFFDRVMMGWARAGRGADVRHWHSLATMPEHWTAPACPLKAADFIKRGFAQGPALGDVLAAAEDAWIDAGFPLDAQRVTAIADETAETFAHNHRL